MSTRQGRSRRKKTPGSRSGGYRPNMARTDSANSVPSLKHVSASNNDPSVAPTTARGRALLASINKRLDPTPFELYQKAQEELGQGGGVVFRPEVEMDNALNNPHTGKFYGFSQYLQNTSCNYTPEILNHPHDCSTHEPNLYMEKAKWGAQQANYASGAVFCNQRASSPSWGADYQARGVLEIWAKLLAQLMTMINMIQTIFNFLIRSSAQAPDMFFAAISLATETLSDFFDLFQVFDKLMHVAGPKVVTTFIDVTAYMANMKAQFSGFTGAPFKGDRNFITNFLLNFFAWLGTTVNTTIPIIREVWNNSSDVSEIVSEIFVACLASARTWLPAAYPPAVIISKFGFAYFLLYFQVDGYSVFDQVSASDVWKILWRGLDYLKYWCGVMEIIYWMLLSNGYNIIGIIIMRPILEWVGFKMPDLKFPSGSSFPDHVTDNSKASRITIDSVETTVQCIPDHIAAVLRFDPTMPPVPLFQSRTEETVCTPGGHHVTVPVQDEQVLENYKHEVRAFNLQTAAAGQRAHSQLVSDAADAIIWCLRLGINTLTLYERQGHLTAEHGPIVNFTTRQLNTLLSKDFVLSEKFEITLFSPEIQVTTSFNHLFTRTTTSTGIEAAGGANTGMLVVLLQESPNNLQSMIDLTKQCAMAQAVDLEMLGQFAMQTLIGTATNPSLMVLPHNSQSTDGFPLLALNNTVVARYQDFKIASFEQSFMRAVLEYSKIIKANVTPNAPPAPAAPVGTPTPFPARPPPPPPSANQSAEAAQRLAAAQYKAQRSREIRQSPIHGENIDHELVFGEDCYD